MIMWAHYVVYQYQYINLLYRKNVWPLCYLLKPVTRLAK